MSEDRHHLFIARHAVAQQGEVMMIDIPTVETQHIHDFIKQAFTRGFNAEHFIRLHDIVGNRSTRVDNVQSQHIQEVGSKGIQRINVFPFKVSRLLVVFHVSLHLDEIDFVQVRHTTQYHIVEKIVLETLQEINLVSLVQAYRLGFLVIHTHQSNTKHDIMVVKVTVKAPNSLVVNTFESKVNFVQAQIGVNHGGLVQGQTKNPPARSGVLFVQAIVQDFAKFSVSLHEFNVFLHKGRHVVRVIVNLRARHEILEFGIFNLGYHVKRFVLVRLIFLIQENGHGWVFHVGGESKNFFHTRHTTSHV